MHRLAKGSIVHSFSSRRPPAPLRRKSCPALSENGAPQTPRIMPRVEREWRPKRASFARNVGSSHCRHTGDFGPHRAEQLAGRILQICDSPVVRRSSWYSNVRKTLPIFLRSDCPKKGPSRRRAAAAKGVGSCCSDKSHCPERGGSVSSVLRLPLLTSRRIPERPFRSPYQGAPS